MNYSIMTRFTIVTPTYNQASTLEATLNSVVNNSIREPKYLLDYHLVDGLSVDTTSNILLQWSSHLASCSSEHDTSIYSALNKGFRRSYGELMGWINSDDFYLADTLNIVAEIFSLFPSIQWLTSLVQLAADCHGRLYLVKKIPGICSAAISDGAFLPGITPYAYGHIQQESTFWRRSLWDAAGGYVSEHHGLAGDYELWQRFSRIAEPVGVTVPLGVFRLRAGQASSGHRYHKDLDQIWRQQQLT